jgi:protein TonB
MSNTGRVVQATPETGSRLGFTASHDGTDWRLVWNRDALKRLGAIGAMLTIRDGGVDRLQFLSPLDLSAGAILYVPRTSDLLFNLKITLPDGPDIEEQIRVLGQDQDAVADVNYPPPRRVGEASRAAVPSAIPATIPAASPRSEAAPAPAEAQPAPVKQFQAPPLPSPKTPAPREVALPEVRLPASNAPALRFTGATAPPLPALPPVQTQAPPVNNPQVITPITTHVDASPLRTVVAQWPRGSARQARMEVHIRVRIDQQGRVVGATPMDRTVANFPFVDSAMAAARLWSFSPATENGKPVASETVLTFKFTP